jgi:hypothetical protein
MEVLLGETDECSKKARFNTFEVPGSSSLGCRHPPVSHAPKPVHGGPVNFMVQVGTGTLLCSGIFEKQIKTYYFETSASHGNLLSLKASKYAAELQHPSLRPH